MTPEQWATDLMVGNQPRIQDGWAEGFRDRIAGAIRAAAEQARAEERDRLLSLLDASCAASRDALEKASPGNNQNYYGGRLDLAQGLLRTIRG